MIKIIKNIIYIIAASILFIYIIICDILMSFSISMNLCFFASIVLLILVGYVINNPIDYTKRGPSFIYTFIKVSSILFFVGVLSIVFFNILYPKHYINENEQTFDYIIVFGAGVSREDNTIINGRIEKAIEYAKKYKRCKFVLTGAKGKDEPIEEAIYMRNYMVERGIDDSQIIIDPFSVNTGENIINSLELIKKDIRKRNPRENIITRPFKSSKDNFDLDFLNIGFMSSDFHLTRINMMAKKLGISRPYDILCETYWLYAPYLYLREDLSLFKALVLNQLKI